MTYRKKNKYKISLRGDLYDRSPHAGLKDTSAATKLQINCLLLDQLKSGYSYARPMFATLARWFQFLGYDDPITLGEMKVKDLFLIERELEVIAWPVSEKPAMKQPPVKLW